MSFSIKAMTRVKSFPELEQFLGGYFHQDWMHDAPDPEGIIQLFVAHATSEQMAGVRQELNKVLNQQRSDAELQDLLIKLGCYVYLSALGVTAREWLTTVRARITELAAAKR